MVFLPICIRFATREDETGISLQSTDGSFLFQDINYMHETARVRPSLADVLSARSGPGKTLSRASLRAPAPGALVDSRARGASSLRTRAGKKKEQAHLSVCLFFLSSPARVRPPALSFLLRASGPRSAAGGAHPCAPSLAPLGAADRSNPGLKNKARDHLR